MSQSFRFSSALRMCFLMLLLMFPLSAMAQSTLNVLRLGIDWPRIETWFRFGCGNATMWDIAPDDVRLTEHSTVITDFTLHCPDTAVDCPMSVALVFDGSATASGTFNAVMKQAGRRFIGRMRPGIDEAAVLCFGDSVVTLQGMTSDTALLYAAVDALPTTGLKAVWEGMLAGFLEADQHGTNPCRAVLLVTNGRNNASSLLYTDVKAFAAMRNIRLYTVAISTHNSSEFYDLIKVCGGEHRYLTDVMLIPSAFDDAAAIIHDEFRECVVRHTSSCADGAMHRMDLQVGHTCGTAQRSVSFRAPLDSSTFETRTVELVPATAESGTEAVLPLMLVESVRDEYFAPITIDVNFDKQRLQFLGAEATTQALLSGVQFFTTARSAGVRIQSTLGTHVSGSGELLRLRFLAGHAAEDTTIVPVSVSGMRFPTGCLLIGPDTAAVRIPPGTLRLHCELDVPRSIAWDTLRAAHAPSPFEARLRVYNTGTLPATGGECTLDIDTTVFLPVTPSSTLAVLPDIPPGEWREAVWTLALRPQAAADSSMLSLTARYGGHEDLRCDARIRYSATGDELVPRCSAPPALAFDVTIQRYLPDPFTVTLRCTKHGDGAVSGLAGTIHLPQGLVPDPPSQPLTRTLHAGTLAPWSPGDSVPSVSWTLRWTGRERADSELPLRFTVEGTGGGGERLSAETVCNVQVPGMRKEVACAVAMPDSLRVDEHGGIVPNPFLLRSTVRNTGEVDILLRRALLGMPQDGIALNATSPLPADAEVDITLAPGASIVLEWLIDVRSRAYERNARFTVTLTDKEDDQTVCDASLAIPAKPVDIDCRILADELDADSLARRYRPMPFTLTLDAWNEKHSVSDSVSARLLLPPGALSLATEEAGHLVKPLTPARLFPQQQGTVQWRLEHPVSFVELRYTVRAAVWESDGDTTYCEQELRIPALPAPFVFTLAAEGPLAFCEGGSVTLDAGAGYTMYEWSTGDRTRTVVVTAGGGYYCEVTRADGAPGRSDSVMVIVFPVPPAPVITRHGDVLLTRPAAVWQWYLDGVPIPKANTQTHMAIETGSYTVRITDGNGCEALSDPFNVGVLPVDEERAVVQRFHPYPNPTDGKLVVDVELHRPSAAVLVLHDLLGREVRRIERVDPRSSFTELFDLHDLEPGVYVLQLRADVAVQTRMLVVR